MGGYIITRLSDFHSVRHVGYVAVFTLVFLCCGLTIYSGQRHSVVHAKSADDVETIVLIRHGELAVGGLGQLDCKGLNRAIALPKVLSAKFPAPSVIFAPDPAVTMTEDGAAFSYVRPLATIEPTAIAQGLRVHAQFGYTDISDLEAAVTDSQYAKDTIYIAWEHEEAYNFARNLLSTYDKNPSDVPVWPSGDYDMIYVFHITRTSPSAKGTLTFAVEQEGLNSLTNVCPKS